MGDGKIIVWVLAMMLLTGVVAGLGGEYAQSRRFNRWTQCVKTTGDIKQCTEFK